MATCRKLPANGNRHASCKTLAVAADYLRLRVTEDVIMFTWGISARRPIGRARLSEKTWTPLQVHPALLFVYHDPTLRDPAGSIQ